MWTSWGHMIREVLAHVSEMAVASLQQWVQGPF
jgi:hypothetical protein